jgi:restriction system protein
LRSDEEAQPTILTPSQNVGAIGRASELQQLNRVLTDGRYAGAHLFGLGGGGKTTLANMYVEEFGDQFEEVIKIDGSFSPSSIFLEVDPQTSPSGAILFVVDDLDAMALGNADNLLAQLSIRLRQNFKSRAILISRLQKQIAGFYPVPVSGLAERDFLELIRLMIGSELYAPPEAEGLYRLAEGNPLVARLAAGALMSGAVRSIQDLVAHLKDFTAVGLVGPDGKPLSTSTEKKIIVDVTNTNEQILQLLKKDPAQALSLSPRQFEEIVCEILAKMGYEATLTPKSKDGGFDIYAARKEGLGRFLYLVECKRFLPPHKVGVHIVRQLHGVLQTQQANAGAIVTTSYFTRGAHEFQQQVPYKMHLHDYISLQKWIDNLPATGRTH